VIEKQAFGATLVEIGRGFLEQGVDGELEFKFF
jgi:hypothetical protein